MLQSKMAGLGANVNDQVDLNNYKGMFYQDQSGVKYQDPVTGAHFDYAEMCRTLEAIIQGREGTKAKPELGKHNKVNRLHEILGEIQVDDSRNARYTFAQQGFCSTKKPTLPSFVTHTLHKQKTLIVKKPEIALQKQNPLRSKSLDKTNAPKGYVKLSKKVAYLLKGNMLTLRSNKQYVARLMQDCSDSARTRNHDSSRHKTHAEGLEKLLASNTECVNAKKNACTGTHSHTLTESSLHSNKKSPHRKLRLLKTVSEETDVVNKKTLISLKQQQLHNKRRGLVVFRGGRNVNSIRTCIRPSMYLQ